MASKFTKEEFDLYVPAFKEFDTNGDGQITAEEFEVRNICFFFLFSFPQNERKIY